MKKFVSQTFDKYFVCYNGAEGIFNFNALTEFYLPRVFFPDMYCWARCCAAAGAGAQDASNIEN